MPDYGHPLRFGVFITPSTDAPSGTVDLAVLAEDLGLDLVTFQDHPYQPALLDTWTLLSWVAARTHRVHVSANVLSLPSRPAAVLARAAASLDLLSGGRFELGIGPGTFWDALEAMGLPRRTPAAESVTALEEAIQVIRGTWDTTGRGPLVVDGRHYSVRGAKRGAAPAHAIPVVLGAYGPRMLRLTGSTADGWVPTMSYLGPGDLKDGNAAIDAAAIDAGRDPSSISRHLIVPPSLGVTDLVDLGRQQGISTFILAADDAGTITAFARSTAPRVRDRIHRAREQHPRTAPYPTPDHQEEP